MHWPEELQPEECITFCRDNVEDALEKLQACIDNAAETLIPAEIDPEKQKQIAKQCVALTACHAWTASAESSMLSGAWCAVAGRGLQTRTGWMTRKSRRPRSRSGGPRLSGSSAALVTIV